VGVLKWEQLTAPWCSLTTNIVLLKPVEPMVTPTLPETPLSNLFSLLMTLIVLRKKSET
jgi:hypothetical protein